MESDAAWLVRIIDRRPFFMRADYRCYYERREEPIPNVRDVYLYRGIVAVMWRVEMMISDVVALYNFCKALGIRVEYDYGTSDVGSRLSSDIPGVD